jgi:hypothetical protein
MVISWMPVMADETIAIERCFILCNLHIVFRPWRDRPSTPCRSTSELHPPFPSQQMQHQRKCASQLSAMSIKWVRRLSSRPISAPRSFPTGGLQSLDHIKKFDEENWDWYSPQIFYPAKIGEGFKSRYQILGKLGYGSHSTASLVASRRLSAPRC